MAPRGLQRGEVRRCRIAVLQRTSRYVLARGSAQNSLQVRNLSSRGFPHFETIHPPGKAARPGVGHMREGGGGWWGGGGGGSHDGGKFSRQDSSAQPRLSRELSKSHGAGEKRPVGVGGRGRRPRSAVLIGTGAGACT